MTAVAVLDVGSTNLRSAVGDPTAGRVGDVTVDSTDADRLVDQIAGAVDDLRARSDEPVEGVGIATTGVVDRDAGVLHFDAADGTETFPVALSELRGRFDLPVVVENDCTAAAMGEYYYGAGTDHRCVVHLTFGTGIGGGVCVGGEPVRGESGRAAEVGLFPVNADDETDSFGVDGAWEAYCSGRGLPSFATTLLAETTEPTVLRERDGVTAADVFAAAADGDAFATELLDRVARYNAAGVGAVVSAYDPGLVTVSGSVATENESLVVDLLRDRVEEYTLVGAPPIEVSRIADSIGLHGALAFFDPDRRDPGAE